MQIKVFKSSKQIQLIDVEVITGWYGGEPTTSLGRVNIQENGIEKIKKTIKQIEVKDDDV